jgi:hypothetical protein
MLQKSSSAHGLRAYYHSFLPVQIKCHKDQRGVGVCRIRWAIDN